MASKRTNTGCIDASGWRNKLYPFYIVQALPPASDPDGYHHLPKQRCAKWRPTRLPKSKGGVVQLPEGGTKPVNEVGLGDVILDNDGKPFKVSDIRTDDDDALVVFCAEEARCPGTSKAAASGAILERQEALHAVYSHYRFPNTSICRFRSPARGDYAADLVFEIDVHDDIEDAVDLAWFHKYIAAGVEVGSRILAHLLDELKVDPRYITTAVTRMGVRVTVDWRAFGPRRLYQLLAVVRYIESQVFDSGELEQLAQQHGVPEIEIDTRIYERSDLPRRGVDESNSFLGSWLRPVGSIHSKSGQGGWWYRTTPVPLDKFTVEEAPWLVKESRGRHESWRTWEGRELRGRFALTVPEARVPEFDDDIERNPEPTDELIELFERDDLLEQLPEAHRDKVQEIRQRSQGRKLEATHRDDQIDADTIEVIARHLDPEARLRGEDWQLDCPRPSCKREGRKATIFASGVFCCFRCTQGMPLLSVANELGIGHMIPVRQQSSKPIGEMSIDEVPIPSYLADWGDNVKVIDRTFADPEDLWADRTRELEGFRSSKTGRVFIDASGLGTGKSVTVGKFLSDNTIRYRALLPRDEAKHDFAVRAEDATVINGRRLRINCDNDALPEVEARSEPIAQTLCSVCTSRKDCRYYVQFDRVKDNNLVLSHAHGSMAHFHIFDNEAEIDLVDEDALSASFQNHDLTAAELNRLRVGWEYDFDGEDSTSLDVERGPCGATPTLETIISRLQFLLSTDTILDSMWSAAQEGELTDTDLAHHLLGDAVLFTAVANLNDEDIKAHEQARLEILQEWQDQVAGIPPKSMGHFLPPRCEQEWFKSKERAEALLADDSMAELEAWLQWSKKRLVPLKGKRDERIHRRPKDIIKPLKAALDDLLYMETMGVSRPSSLQAFRPDDQGSWTMRLTTRRGFLLDSKKIIHLSSTAVPERMRLLYGEPSPSAKWLVYRANLVRKEKRVMVADRAYSRKMILGKKAEGFRTQFFETVDALVEREKARTGLPVAVIGPSKVVNAYLKHRLGKDATSFTMPFKGHEREEKMEGLRDLTEPLGFLAGYAHGVAGSNDFCVEQDGKTRFVRSLIVLGNPLPNLKEVARANRGLFAGVEDRPVDWTIRTRSVAFTGTEKDGKVTVAKNVYGYRHNKANALLHGIYEGELEQIIGRMRGQLDDPIDATIVPQVVVFAGVAIPGWEVDRVATLNDVREVLGLPVEEPKKRGPKSSLSNEEQIQRRWRKDGARKTFLWLVKDLVETHGDMAVTMARIEAEGAGFTVRHAYITEGEKLLKELLAGPGLEGGGDASS